MRIKQYKGNIYTLKDEDSNRYDLLVKVKDDVVEDLFGKNIVKNMFIEIYELDRCSYDVKCDSKNYLQDLLNCYESYKSIGEINKDLELNGSDIESLDATNCYIEFINGKFIKIWNSEWGGIDSINMEDKDKNSFPF